jgi:hypothetical protein
VAKKISDLKNGDRMSLADYKTMQSLCSNTEEPQGRNKKNPRTKYNAKAVVIDGQRFDSTFEGKRYSQLKMLERLKEIRDLRLQVTYPLIVNDVAIASYVADFVYISEGSEVVEDAKGYLTPVYKLKKKLMKAIYDIDIFETRSGSS